MFNKRRSIAGSVCSAPFRSKVEAGRCWELCHGSGRFGAARRHLGRGTSRSGSLAIVASRHAQLQVELDMQRPTVIVAVNCCSAPCRSKAKEGCCWKLWHGSGRFGPARHPLGRGQSRSDSLTIVGARRAQLRIESDMQRPTVIVAVNCCSAPYRARWGLPQGSFWTCWGPQN